MSGDLVERFPGAKHFAMDGRSVMSAPTATLTAGMVPAKWRVLNALVYADRWTRVSALIRDQGTTLDDLVGLEQRGLLLACVGERGFPIKLADLREPGATEVRLSTHGHRRVTTNPANQVITCLGGKPSQRARVRDCRAEGMADDDLLRQMESCHLINVTAGATPVPLAAFRRIPPQLLVHLSAKGRRYYPSNWVGR